MAHPKRKTYFEPARGPTGLSLQATTEADMERPLDDRPAPAAGASSRSLIKFGHLRLLAFAVAGGLVTAILGGYAIAAALIIIVCVIVIAAVCCIYALNNTPAGW